MRKKERLAQAKRKNAAKVVLKLQNLAAKAKLLLLLLLQKLLLLQELLLLLTLRLLLLQLRLAAKGNLLRKNAQEVTKINIKVKRKPIVAIQLAFFLDKNVEYEYKMDRQIIR
jgi:hypothetical protein